MSKTAIGEALELLRHLPDSDQEAVLQFLKSLKSRAPETAPNGSPSAGSALRKVNGLLVFTGEIDSGQTDWLKVIREERDQDILRTAETSAGE